MKLSARETLAWLPIGLRGGNVEGSAVLLADIARGEPAIVADVLEAGCAFPRPAAVRAVIDAARALSAEYHTFGTMNTAELNEALAALDAGAKEA